MASNMNSAESPTAKAMGRAIDLAIEGNSHTISDRTEQSSLLDAASE